MSDKINKVLNSQSLLQIISRLSRRQAKQIDEIVDTLGAEQM